MESRPLKGIEMRYILTWVLSCCLAISAHAADATTAWKKVLQKCAKSDKIGKRVLFFGLSNDIGPGSVWRLASDKSVRLQYELSDAFPDVTERAKLVNVNNTEGCVGDSSSDWNLKLGLPFTTGVTPVSASIAATLSRASKVTVSVTGFSIDELKGTNWKVSFKSLGPGNAYFDELYEQDRLLAENMVKVSGFKAVLVFGTKLSADVQAQFKGRRFSLGGSDSGASERVKSQSTEPETGGANSTAGAGGSTPGPGAPKSGTDAAAKEKKEGATLHADVTNDNTITLTAEGPFYMIAAYSKLEGGKPIGLEAVKTAPVVLKSVELPEVSKVASERKGH